MLVVTRRTREGVHIGNNIHVVILDIDHGKVRLGIAAPEEVSIYRDEVYDRIQREIAKEKTEQTDF